MQERLTTFEREGDLDLMRQRARADNARALKRIVAALGRHIMRLAAPAPRGHVTPAR